MLCQYLYGSRATGFLSRCKLGGTHTSRRKPQAPNVSFQSKSNLQPTGNTAGVGYVHSAICHSFWRWGENCPTEASPGYIQNKKLPPPALSEPVAEALVLACASQTLGFLMLFPVLTFYCFLTSSEHRIGIRRHYSLMLTPSGNKIRGSHVSEQICS